MWRVTFREKMDENQIIWVDTYKTINRSSSISQQEYEDARQYKSTLYAIKAWLVKLGDINHIVKHSKQRKIRKGWKT